MQSPTPAIDESTTTKRILSVFRRAFSLVVRGKYALPMAVAFTLTLPLFMAISVLYSQDWAPIVDMALIEQKVRDIGTARTPLLGPIGRMGSAQKVVHHPGPIIYFMLAPVYWLLGGSAWGLQVSAAFLNAVSATVAVLIVWRRRSVAALGVAGVGLALLMQGFGPALLTEPWNPNLAVLWFAVFLVAVWSVACRDFAMMPVVIMAASICAQTHIAYVPVCGGLGALAVIIVFILVVCAPKGSDERKWGLRWIGVSCALLAVLWLPPMIQELRVGSGNVSLMIQYFTSPENQPIGILQALPLVLSRFDLWHVIVDQSIAPGGFDQALPLRSPEPRRGFITLLVWVLAAIGAIRLRSNQLLALHGVALAGIGVSMVATSRIVGYPYTYLMYWCWGLGILLLVACLATAGLAVGRGRPHLWLQARMGRALAVGSVALCTVRSAWGATEVRPQHYRQATELKWLALDTIRTINSGAGVATGLSGRYLVSWSDQLHSGQVAIGLANELERSGFHAAYEQVLAPIVGTERAKHENWATARVHYANGAWIDEVRLVRGAVEAAWVDARTAEERAEAERLMAAIVAALRKDGREDLVKRIGYDVPGVLAAHPGIHPYIALGANRLMEIGGPAAVFILPPRASPAKMKGPRRRPAAPR